MFFVTSKMFWLIFAPSHVIVWCAAVATFLLVTGRRRAGTAMTAATALLLLLTGLIPSYIWLGRPLEDRFDAVPLPARADGILVLAGGWEEDASRLAMTQVLARRYPDARVVFTGGSGSLLNNTPYVEAQHAKDLLIALGLSPARLTTEGRSRNTFENFSFTKSIVKPQPGQTWVLVTSGYHMARAMKIAENLGWRLVPRISSRLTPRQGMQDWFDVSHNLAAFDLLVREDIGLIAYRLSGRAGK